MPPSLFRHGRTIVVVRDLGVDEYGDPIAGSPTRTPVEKCVWAPRTQGAGSSTENLDDRGRQGVIVGLTLYAPYGSDIRHTDQVELPGGALYKIEGDPGEWWNPYTGDEPGMEINLRRSEG